MGKLGMVLEGGGLRGIYTAGALDCLTDNQIAPEGIFGVSAGACNAVSYISGQRGRNYRVNTAYLDDWRYRGLRSFVKTGDVFGADFVYRRVPDELDPFDYQAFSSSPIALHVVVTNLMTGEAEYRRLTDLRREMDWLRASASLPLLSTPVEIEGAKYLDGGTTDSIPLARSEWEGYSRNLVILTRPAGYKKERGWESALASAWYLRYPEFARAARVRHLRYNQALEAVAQAERQGQALVLRPSKPVRVGRLERRIERLRALYVLGYMDTAAALPRIRKFVAP